MIGRATIGRSILFAGLLTTFFVLNPLQALSDSEPPLTFEERVKAQEAIERVYYEKRIWPKENPGPKPPFEKMVSAETIRAKAEDAVLKSHALEANWGRPLTSEQLQAEMDRFAKKTKDPEGLKALFAALDNDPTLIAEVLARQTLSDRLIRTWYAWDPRFHKDKRRLAEEIADQPEAFLHAPPSGVGVVRARFDLATGEPLEGDSTEQVSLPDEEDAPSFKIPAEILSSLNRGGSSKPVILVTEEEDFFIASRYEREAPGIGVVWTVRADKTPFVTWWQENRKSLSLSEGMERMRNEGDPCFTLRSLENATPSSPDSWKALDAPPTSRSLHTAVWTGAEMIVWGGICGESLDSGGIYSPITDSWRHLAFTASSPAPRSNHTAVWTGSEMVIWGGSDPTKSPVTYFNDGGKYDPVTNSWVHIPDYTALAGRKNHSAVWTGDRMLIWGGENAASYFSNGATYDPSDSTWISMPTGSLPQRSRHIAVWTGSEMVIWGGYNGVYLADGARYSPALGTWMSISDPGTNLIARADHRGVWASGQLLIWGGSNGSPLASGAIYKPALDPAPNTWTAMATTDAPSARRNHTAIWTGTNMIVWGGGEENSSSDLAGFNDGGRFEPFSNTWLPVDTTTAPQRRHFHTAVWTGNEMLIWGGTPSSQEFSINSGGRYSPTLNSWIPMGSNQIPVPRNDSIAVWTGNEMVIWGGAYIPYTNNPIALASGGRYSPTTDSWTPTSNTDAPTARYYHAGVWTGAKMVVWGGYPPATNTGGMYNPSTDSWQATSTLGSVPSARHSHTMVWTGARALVWGGLGATGGGQLDPDTNAWTEITSSGAPSSRYAHAAIWTGSRMMVWGGGNPQTTFYNSGGIYDPSTNSWVSTSSSNTPIGRCYYSLSWTGSRALVWGGVINSSGTTTNTGGLYDVSNNLWAPAAMGVGVPTNRYSTSGLGTWTGYEAIIWGGRPQYLNGNVGRSLRDGGRYEPLSSTWIPMEVSADSPDARNGHISLWTGTGLIIWGGSPASNSGAIFYPNTPPRAIGEILNNYLGQTYTLALGSADSLQLDGSASTSGSNPGSIPAYEDTFDSIVEYAWDLNGDVALNSDGELASGSFDRFSSTVTIPQEDLGLFDLDQPGDKTITFRVTDKLGIRSWQTLTLHLLDVSPPTVTVVSPNGGESWPYSMNTSARSQKLLVWTASDNLGLSRLKLSYTTKPSPGESDWVCIADTELLGGDCAPAGLQVTAASFLWDLPTQAEAAAVGQTFPSSTALIRVQAWDGSNNLTIDTSDSTFYIVQPTATAVRTLILTNTDRIGSASQVSAKLGQLAAHPKVNGVVLDLKNVAGLASLYTSWDADSPISDANPVLANAVAEAIRDYVKSQVDATYTNAKYLVLAGDDYVIPFYRVADFTATLPEHPNYDPFVDCATPVGRATCANTYFSDGIFGDIDYDTTDCGMHFVALPDLATGRLVETPQEIMDTVDTFLAMDGQVDLNRGLVTGYDFMEDCAAHERNSFTRAGVPVDPLIGEGWTASELEGLLFSATPHAVNSLNDHSDHFSLGAPDTTLSAIALDTAHPGTPLRGVVFYSPGCHSGYVAPDAWASGNHPLDLPQMFLRKGVAAYVGNTGFGWGFKNGSGYSERLVEMMTDRLVSGQSPALGDALAEGKRDYYVQTRKYDVFDEKVLFQSTLFGLPMYQVAGSSTLAKPGEELLHAEGPDEQEAGGVTMKKDRTGSGSASLLPPGVTELTLSFDFSAPGVYERVDTTDGSGSYYTLNGKSSSKNGEPIQPLFIYDSRLSGTTSHGVLFTGGTYSVIHPFDPVIGVLASAGPPLGEGPIAPGMGSLIGITNATHPKLPSSLILSELTRMTVYTGYYDGGDESLFQTMGFVIYYHATSTDRTGPAITDAPALHVMDGLTARFAVTATDASGVYRVLISYNDYQGSWQSLDLSYNAGSGHWEGSLALKRDIAYIVQAVDNAGNVSTLTLTGPDLDSNGQPTGSTYSNAEVFTVHLQDTDSDGLPDAFENAHGLNPAIGTGNDGATGDPDLDGYTNMEEFLGDTDPQIADSDGDGDNDGSEAHHGRNPLNPSDGKRITIGITKVGDDVTISWPSVSGDNAVIDGPYWVYRSTDPFFSSGEELATTPSPIPSSTREWTDLGGGSGPDYFYTVTNTRYAGPAPAVDAVVPTTGPAAGGTTISIYGSDFVSGATVRVGGTLATSVTFVNSAKITCKTPPGAVGPVDITVTNPNGQFGTLAGGFTYY